MEEHVKRLAPSIFAQLVVLDFYQPNGMSYEEMEIKANEAAEYFYKD